LRQGSSAVAPRGRWRDGGAAIAVAARKVRATLAAVEYDEQPNGISEPGIIEWVSYRKLGELPLFPLIGKAAAALPSSSAPVVSTYLPPVTDQDYTWIASAAVASIASTPAALRGSQAWCSTRCGMYSPGWLRAMRPVRIWCPPGRPDWARLR
jgi:hypothetical protein